MMLIKGKALLKKTKITSHFWIGY